MSNPSPTCPPVTFTEAERTSVLLALSTYQVDHPLTEQDHANPRKIWTSNAIESAIAKIDAATLP